MRGRSVWIVAAVLVALVATACSDDGGADSANGSEKDTATPFEGTNWLLTGDSDLGVDLGTSTITARFDAGTVTGSSGCNRYRGSFTRDGAMLDVSQDFVTTRIACPVDDAYLDALRERRTISIEGSTLTLGNRHGDLVYRATGADDVAGEWTVTSYYTGSAIQSVVGGVELTADFDATTVSGSGGCNRFNGPVALTSNAIEIGPLASTLVGCAEPIATQEQQYFAALELASTYTVSGDRLDLFRADGGFAVTLHRSG